MWLVREFSVGELLSHSMSSRQALGLYLETPETHKLSQIRPNRIEHPFLSAVVVVEPTAVLDQRSRPMTPIRPWRPPWQ